MRAQRIIGFHYIGYPQANEVRTSDHSSFDFVFSSCQDCLLLQVSFASFLFLLSFNFAWTDCEVHNFDSLYLFPLQPIIAKQYTHTPGLNVDGLASPSSSVKAKDAATTSLSQTSNGAFIVSLKLFGKFEWISACASITFLVKRWLQSLPCNVKAESSQTDRGIWSLLFE